MKYTGGCHCGKVQFDVEVTIDKVMSCNCSICAKKGSLLVFTPEGNLKLLCGAEDLSDYQFGKKTIHHLFCKTCGISPFGKGTNPDGTKMAAINVRCLDNVDFTQFPVFEFDGKSL